MTPRREHDEEEKKGILERILERLSCIGMNVERLVDRIDLHSAGRNRTYDDEWSPEDLYENGEY